MKFYLFIISIIIPSLLIGQENIRGKITDGDGVPLIGATVIEKGTESNGTVTDAEGVFLLTVSSGATLEVSYLGYKSLSVTPSGNIVNLVMEQDSEVLSDVEVVGFATVTGRARKRLENIQKIGESITAISGADIEAQGSNSIGDVLGKIANVSYNNYQDAGNFTINIRGITSVRNGEAPVSIVVDDIQLSVTEQLISDFYDIEQIELLKGPQGTLYGRNAIGGAINYTTKQPTNILQGKIKASYATGNDIKLLGAVSGGLVKDKLYGSLAASYRNFAGYENQRNTFLDELTNWSDELSVRGQLIADVSPSVRLTLRGQYSDLSQGSYPYIQTTDDGTGASDFSGQPQANLLGESDLTTADINFKAEFRTDIGRVLAISSFADGGYTSRGDLDHTSAESLWQFADRGFNAFNQEIRLISKDYKKVNYVAGIFYQTKQTTPLFQAGLDGGMGYDGTAFPASVSENTNNTLAAFAQVNFKVTDQIELTGGLRMDSDNREQDDKLNEVIRDETFSQLQPKLGVSFQASDQTLIFANYAVGYRSGGFNAPRSTDVTVTNPNQFREDYDKEVTNNIELGIKNTLLDNRLIVNASLFRTAFDNEQVYVVDLATVTTGIFNMEEVVNQGLEVEAKYRINKILDIGGSFGLIDSEIKQADVAQFFANEEGIIGSDWTGNKAPFVSDNTSSIYADLHIKDFKLFVDLNRLGNFYWHPDNFDVQSPVNLVNFKASYGFKGLKLAVFGNNIFNIDYNQEYFNKEFSTAPLDLRYPAAPAVFGVELQYSF